MIVSFIILLLAILALAADLLSPLLFPCGRRLWP